jgi:23S rRNA (cytidine1920-2'-O)/16S rRNA (cytidine1409-2'-O)-methyltransferase
VRRGLAPSRERAQADIDAGRVVVNGTVAAKASRQVAPGEPIVVRGPPPRFVSRGGEKLDAALARFGVEVTGRRTLDAGASTGGFCDCLLQRGATEVLAVDVGYGQLHERIRNDPRVRLLDRTNVRHLAVAAIGEPVDLVTVDLSFISVTRVIRPLLDVARPGADVVVLVKPQFEAGRQEASRGKGIITDPAIWRRVLGEVIAAVRDEGATMMGAMVSPLRGTEGNVEFLIHAVAPARSAPAPSSPAASASVAAMIDAALVEAEDRAGR